MGQTAGFAAGSWIVRQVTKKDVEELVGLSSPALHIGRWSQNDQMGRRFRR